LKYGEWGWAKINIKIKQGANEKILTVDQKSNMKGNKSDTI
jgi:hypothetical protein